jgi:hypothetical protein
MTVITATAALVAASQCSVMPKRLPPGDVNTGPQVGPVAEHLVYLGADLRTPEGGTRA